MTAVGKSLLEFTGFRLHSCTAWFAYYDQLNRLGSEYMLSRIIKYKAARIIYFQGGGGNNKGHFLKTHFNRQTKYLNYAPASFIHDTSLGSMKKHRSKMSIYFPCYNTCDFSLVLFNWDSALNRVDVATPRGARFSAFLLQLSSELAITLCKRCALREKQRPVRFPLFCSNTN